MGDWHQEMLLKTIKRYQALVPDVPILVVTTGAGEPRFGDCLRAELGGNTLFRLAQLGEEHEQMDGVSAVALVSGSLSDATRSYAFLSAAKNAGLPVVFAQSDRPMSTSAPTWENSGVTHAGMFYLASQYARSVQPKGAYCEFGVYDGRTMVMAGHALKDACTKFVAYDSFKGLGGTKPEETTHYNDGEYFANQETLRHNFRFSKLPLEKLEIVPGYFQDTLSGRRSSDDGIGPISVVHIDTDIYEPALLALEYVSDGLSDGALLIFDDYDQLAASNKKGERRALHEWLDAHPEFEAEPYRCHGAFGRSFIIHRNG
jgi:hypothetical protein